MVHKVYNPSSPVNYSKIPGISLQRYFYAHTHTHTLSHTHFHTHTHTHTHTLHFICSLAYSNNYFPRLHSTLLFACTIIYLSSSPLMDIFIVSDFFTTTNYTAKNILWQEYYTSDAGIFSLPPAGDTQFLLVLLVNLIT